MQRKRKAVTDPLGSPKFICALNLYISNFIGTEAYDNPEANAAGFFWRTNQNLLPNMELIIRKTVTRVLWKTHYCSVNEVLTFLLSRIPCPSRKLCDL